LRLTQKAVNIFKVLGLSHAAGEIARSVSLYPLIARTFSCGRQQTT